MSFLVDIVLIGILLLVVVAYARKSIFSAGLGTAATAVAVVASLLLTPLLSPWVAEYAFTPLTEQVVANELADMHSAPHLATAEETVAALPLDAMLTERSEGYLQLLEKYGVTAETVEAAYRDLPQGIAVVRSIAAPLATALSETAVFLLLSLLLTVILTLIVRRVEQNLPPQRRYHGIKQAVPALFGALSGLVWSWVATLVLSWVVPVASGYLVFLTPSVLENTDWYTWIQLINPLVWLT